MTKPGRIPCEVIGCRRTADASKYEPNTRIVCYKCWQLGDKRDRRLYARCKKLMKLGKRKTALGKNLWWLKNQAWECVLKKAIERRVGITA